VWCVSLLVFYDSAKFCSTDRAAKEKRMTHSDKGNYAGRHPGAVEANEAVIQAVRNTARNGAMLCAAAHSIAHTCAVSPEEAGRAIDAAEIRIAHCQLGIFKHSTDRPAAPTEPALTPELKEYLSSRVVNGRLPCKSAWSVAKRFNLSRLQIGVVCDRLGIKISACQLGTFR
jgi:hypothetical protein